MSVFTFCLEELPAATLEQIMSYLCTAYVLVDDYTCLNNLNDSHPSLCPTVAIHHSVSISSSFYV